MWGRGGGAGKVSVQDISFTKYIDKSTPNLIKGPAAMASTLMKRC
jgi:type VI protein secretion system component Hcp